MKYTPHKRYREPAIIDAPPKVRIKRKKSPRPKDVARARQAITNLVQKYGHKRYRKHRRKADRIVKEALKKYHIEDTSSTEYWRLALICSLLGV